MTVLYKHGTQTPNYQNLCYTSKKLKWGTMRQKIKNMDRGILLMFLASLSFAMMGGFAKVLTDALPPVDNLSTVY